MTADRTVIALFSMPLRGRVQALLPLVTGLARRGAEIHAFTHADFRTAFERAGARFVDLFADRPLETVDDRSLPPPCRYVAYAGARAVAVAADVAPLRPSLVVHESFAVLGAAVAQVLGLPAVRVFGGNALASRHLPEVLTSYPRVAVAPECHAAVDALRGLGLPDASPFLFLTGRSRHLNVCAEPPQFVEEQDRLDLAPMACFGSLPWDGTASLGNRAPHGAPVRATASAPPPTAAASGAARGPSRRPRAYVSFGTVIWRHFPVSALAALRTITAALADGGADVRVGLGGWAEADRAIARLAGPRVRVERDADQWRELAAADVFVTHHGLNSTHEAIWHGVPMISVPFFFDQPRLARRCQELGLAVPLGDGSGSDVRRQDVLAALARVTERGPELARGLARARQWELDVMAGREALIDRILALAGTRPHAHSHAAGTAAAPTADRPAVGRPTADRPAAAWGSSPAPGPPALRAGPRTPGPR